MARKRRAGVPAELNRLRQRIDRWRSDRKKLGPMPAELWQLASELASEHGVYLVSRTLGVNYERLKERVHGRLVPRTKSNHPTASPQFVELFTGPTQVPAGASEYVIELRAVDGTTMTIRSSGRAMVDLAELVEAFGSRMR